MIWGGKKNLPSEFLVDASFSKRPGPLKKEERDNAKRTLPKKRRWGEKKPRQGGKRTDPRPISGEEFSPQSHEKKKKRKGDGWV